MTKLQRSLMTALTSLAIAVAPVSLGLVSHRTTKNYAVAYKDLGRQVSSRASDAQKASTEKVNCVRYGGC